MDYRIEFDAGRSIVLLSFQEEFTESSATEGFRALAAFAGVNSIETILLDFSEILKVRVSLGFVRTLIDSNTVIAPGKTRVVVAPSVLIYAVAQTFRPRQGAEANIVLFRNMPQALRFLKADPPEFRPVNAAPL